MPDPGQAEAVRLYPTPSKNLRVSDIHAGIIDEAFKPHPNRPFVSINMVSSIDGKVSIQGTSSDLGSTYDRVVMNTIRSGHDAIMVGLGTIRAEKYSPKLPEPLAQRRLFRGLRPQPWLVLATTSEQFPHENLIHADSDNTLILRPESAEGRLESADLEGKREWIKGKSPERTIDIAQALRLLRKKYDVKKLLVEGGPSLNHQLAEAGLVDQLFLTVSPKLLGGSNGKSPGILQGNPLKTPTELMISTSYIVDNEVFLHYKIRS